jgi:formylmethanofuran dehydrogenase subunit E
MADPNEILKNGRCMSCGEEDLFLMRYFAEDEDLELCKKCYDTMIDEELALTDS